MRAGEFITEGIGDKRTDTAGSDEYVINKYLVKFTPNEILFYKGGELVYKKSGNYTNVTRGDVSVATKITTMLWEKDQKGLVPNMEYTDTVEKLTLLKRELDNLIRKSTYGSYEHRKYTKKYNEASQQLKHLKSTQSEWRKKSEPTPVTEVFQSGKQNWEWKFRGSEEAIADFTVGDRTYQWVAYSHVLIKNPTKWEIQFRLLREDNDPDDLDLFGTTGTGNSAEVLSTAVDITRAFLKEYGDKVLEITFNAKENSRIGLYVKMINRLLPDWDLHQRYVNNSFGMEFYLTNPKAYELHRQSKEI